jgi:formate dehydrogenase (NADP+) alpha subunit
MKETNNILTVDIDGLICETWADKTILEVAQQNGIYIPTLCDHKDLHPFGGCRMCLVEVEGSRLLMTACTTPVQNDMVIRTDTPQIRSEREEVMTLILTEHPVGCLVCSENENCADSMSTTRKVGMTTGCSNCPENLQCELQDIVHHLKITSLDLPVTYRALPVEKYDPFYDRDYNLCILCGRCVRVCQELRLADVLTFRDKGPAISIGTAYDRSHIDAGCEFCGACVTVCPTGAISEKMTKWLGKIEDETLSTCALCGLGCQIKVRVKDGEVIGTLAADDPHINRGQLCVKGRFSIAELVSNYRRLKSPAIMQEGRSKSIKMDEAIDRAVEKLSTCPPDQFGLLISPDCTNEDLYIAQKFCRVVMKSNHIDTTARQRYGSGFNAYMKLLQRSAPLSNVSQANTILCLGLDTRFGRSVVGVWLQRARKREALIATIHPGQHNLVAVSDLWIQPHPGEMLETIQALLKACQSETNEPDGNHEIIHLAKLLKQDSSPVILLGSETVQQFNSAAFFETLEQLADACGAHILAMPAQANLRGSATVGAYPDRLPDGLSPEKLERTWGAPLPTKSGWSIDAVTAGDQQLDVLYLIGALPTIERPNTKCLIYQNITAPPVEYKTDLTLPGAAFTEVDGTFINGAGLLRRVRQAVNPPGEALPDWAILCRIAQKMGATGFDFENAKAIHTEIANLRKGFENFDMPGNRRIPLEAAYHPVGQTHPTNVAPRNSHLILNTLISEHTYHGLELLDWVGGLQDLIYHNMLEISPHDARQLGVGPGDTLVVSYAAGERTWPVRIIEGQPDGVLTVQLDHNDPVGAGPHIVKARKNHV